IARPPRKRIVLTVVPPVTVRFGRDSAGSRYDCAVATRARKPSPATGPTLHGTRPAPEAAESAGNAFRSASSVNPAAVHAWRNCSVSGAGVVVRRTGTGPALPWPG